MISLFPAENKGFDIGWFAFFWRLGLGICQWRGFSVGCHPIVWIFLPVATVWNGLVACKTKWMPVALYLVHCMFGYRLIFRPNSMSQIPIQSEAQVQMAVRVDGIPQAEGPAPWRIRIFYQIVQGRIELPSSLTVHPKQCCAGYIGQLLPWNILASPHRGWGLWLAATPPPTPKLPGEPPINPKLPPPHCAPRSSCINGYAISKHTPHGVKSSHFLRYPFRTRSLFGET